MKTTLTNCSSIALIGFMCAGKTSCGKKTAKALGYSFIDSDGFIEEKHGLSIQEIFSRYGESHFRQLEAECIKEICGVEKTVISLGGGAVKNPQTMSFIKQRCLVLFLNADAHKIYENYKKSGVVRPLLQTDDVRATISQLLAERIPLYTKYADVSIDVTDFDLSESVSLILSHLRGKVL